MKICQVCAVQFTAEKFLLNLVDGLKANGHEVVMMYNADDRKGNFQLNGRQIHSIKITRNFNIFSKFFEIIAIYRYFKKEQYDVVHCHTPIGGLVGRIAAKLAGVEFIIYTVHGFYFHENSSKLAYFIYSNIEKILGKITNLILTVSNEDYSTAISHSIISEKCIAHIGNGVDSTKFDPVAIVNSKSLRNFFKIDSDDFVIGLVSRLVREKGIIEFLSAAEKLQSSNPDWKIKFLVVGEILPSERDQTLKTEMKGYIKTLGDSLILAGSRDDIPNMLSIMNVFCLPSWREGLPVSIIEAMMMNKFVIATNIRGSRELINDPKLGLIVKPKSSNDLVKAFHFCLANPEKISHENLISRKVALEKYEINLNTKFQVGLIENRVNTSLKQC